MYENLRKWYNLKKIEDLKGRLEKKGYRVFTIEDENSIEEFIEENIGKEETIGIGGSVTIRELRIDKILKERGNIVYNHWEEGLTGAEISAAIKKHPNVDCFITSTNAVTKLGEIINIDTTGNRVASMIFGPKRVVMFIGINKIADDIEAGLKRIRNVACPLNSKRKELGTSCEKYGKCINCNDEKKFCNIITIIEKKPPTIDFTIILLPFEYGF